MENFEKSWKRSWKVMEFQKPKRVLVNRVKNPNYHFFLKIEKLVEPVINIGREFQILKPL